MSLLGRLAARRRAIASGAVVSVATAGVLVAVFTTDGFPAADVHLNDSGVWVTKSDAVLLGRLNRQVDQIDGTLAMVSHDFDVQQSAGTILVTDREGGKLVGIEPSFVRAAGQADLPGTSQVALGGSVSALIETKSGRAWVRPGTGVTAVKPKEDDPDLDVGADAAVAVGVDGTAYAVSGRDGTMATLTAAGLKSTRSLPGVVSRDKIEISAVGAIPVVLDPGASMLFLDGQDPVDLSSFGGNPRLQQAGTAAEQVLVATDDTLVAVPLAGGEPVRIGGGGGKPAAPVFLDGCAHAAWSARPTYLRACGDSLRTGADPKVQAVPGIAGGAANLTFRVNRHNIVLNDVASGGIWLLDEQLKKIDNWDTTQPKENSQKEDESKEEPVDQVAPKRSATNHPPKAVDDRLGARPGQSTVLRVLDNDTDPDGDPLAIPKPPQLSPSQGKLELIENGQALQFTPAGGLTGSVTFSYTVTDGRGGADTGAVTIEVRPLEANAKPRLKPGRTSTVVVEEGKTAQYNVLADWEDPDGDPLTLSSAAAGTADTVRYTAAGLVTFVDVGGQRGVRKKVDLVVSDGQAETAGKLEVQVKPAGINIPPTARNDLFVARVGQRATLRPLLNDSDPNNDELRLAQVQNLAGVSIDPDYANSTIEFTANRAGSYVLEYSITDGPKTATAVIRVDVRGSEGNSPPVAVGDTMQVPEGASAVADLVANDLDLDGDVLVVRSVTPPQDSGLTVSVLDLHILRVEADRALPRPVSLSYEVSDGLASAQGTVVVRTVSSSAANQPPLTKDDSAVVRAGDVVSIPVLGNDTDPDGDRLSLSPTITGLKPGQGLLFASGGSTAGGGNLLRFQAPDKPTTVTAVYTAVDARGAKASGQVTINVRAADAKKNSPPSPPDVEARVFAGSTVRIKVALNGTDPDGDSVRVTGPASASRLGRVVRVDDGDTLVYEAFDTEKGTDSFSYAVQDALGAQAVGSVRVGVVPRPESNSPPVAIDDLLRVRPGKDVAVPVLGNDSDPDGDAISLESVGSSAGSAATAAGDDKLAGLNLRPLGDRVAMTVPKEATTLTVPYAISDGRGGRDTAFLTVQVDPDAPAQPPVAHDDVIPDLSTAKDVGGRKTIEVDVRKNDEDPDGVLEDLRVTLTGPAAEAGTVTPGQAVRIPLTDVAQTLAYQVTDVDELTSTAFVRVPGAADGTPRLRKPGAVLTTTAGAPLVIKLADHVVDPQGDDVRLTQVNKASATNSDGSPPVTNPTTLTFRPKPGYVGPAGITFEVTDGTGPDDPKGHKAVLSLLIDVKPGANVKPTFRPSALKVAAGEAPVSVDLREFVTDPDPGDQANARFSGLGGVPSGLTAKLTGSTLSVSAGPEVRKGTRAQLRLSVTDGHSPPVPATVDVTVGASTRPLARANPDTVADAVQGKAVTIPVLANDANPFPDKPLKLTGVNVLSGTGNAVVNGDQVVFTPGGDFFGTARLSYTVADATGDPDRNVTGQITVSVKGRPAKPVAAPTITDSGDRFVALRLTAPLDNGASITRYDVQSQNGFSTTCASDVCRLEGLTNAVEYTFQYRAVNEVGEGDWSPMSAAVTPDRVPDQPNAPGAAFVAGGEGRQITVTWAAPQNLGSPIEEYILSVSPPTANGSEVSAGNATSKVVDGLTNGVPYTFKVLARNAKGRGPYSAASGAEVPAGIPSVPSAPSAANSGGALGEQVTVSWGAPAANGADITAYTLRVFRDGSLVNTVSTGSTSQNVTATNGTTYTFDVTATNKSGTSAASSRSAGVAVFGKPFQVGSVSATPHDGYVQLGFSAPNDNGQAIARYEVSVNGGGFSTLASNKIVSGLGNGSSYRFSVRACNDYCGDGSGQSAAAVPYGPPRTPSVTGSRSGMTVNFSWTAPSSNGRAISNIQTSLNGGAFTNRGAGNGSLSVDGAPDTTYTLQVRAVDSEGQISGTDSASVNTPTPTISLSKGTSAVGQPGCGHESCAYVNISMSNFEPNTTYTLVPHDNTALSPPNPRSVTTNGSGSYSGRGWYFGFPGKQTWATVGSYESNHITW